MFSSVFVFVLAFVLLEAPLFARAGLYVVSPSKGSVCHGGQPCTIEWLDDGTAPLLSAIGVATVGLYTGKQKIVQWIQAVDVTTAHSITFTPNPAAGPNSDAYYIAITSTSLKKTNDSTIPYSGWSPYFRLDRMSGSFDTPLPSATASIQIPSSLLHAATQSAQSTSTVTIGHLSTSQAALNSTPIPSASASASKMITSVSPASSTHSSTASSSAASSSSTSTASTSGASGLSALTRPFFLAAISAMVLCTVW
ncbi:uncharacterized protein LACBIDRAFT_325313 [Laccaria bicolor S238N-H82]|uniref:Predicted protein n=1 Tax=Laccaria bicolor (strain S238N-H82 / ATCC MYA-4686) TaxID=486041 RepID=B0D4I2_LACBS|nr:uncharacterized protein LACBIDRAFT_325313 [Laccaria bicolor S238N-H82]EDR10348.1 predicted protein [Laccaria bicolor S238N-H82]|eukprot:XP_001878798.1 predicted protein [Laccaria bicolor S238N-H82]